jgi:hypothetical protein
MESLPGKDDTVRALADRAEISDLVLRYWDGVRRNDAKMMTSVFSDDALLDFPHGPVRGFDNILKYFSGRLGADKAKNRGLDALLDAMPAITNVLIDVKMDEAHCECTVFSVTLAIRGGKTVLVLDGGRSIDELTRTAQGWRIRIRRKVELWNAEMPATSLLPTG